MEMEKNAVEKTLFTGYEEVFSETSGYHHLQSL